MRLGSVVVKQNWTKHVHYIGRYHRLSVVWDWAIVTRLQIAPQDVQYKTQVPYRLVNHLCRLSRDDSFHTWPINVGPTLQSVFITLSKGFYHSNLLHCCRYRLLNLPDTRRRTQRRRSVGLAPIGQGGEENNTLYNPTKFLYGTKSYRFLYCD
jgi:hypothetical protein